MADLEIIDIHAHIFQTADIGTRYQQALGRRNPERNGTVEEMQGFMKRLGISHTAMLLYSPTTEMFDRRVPDFPREPRERAEAIKNLREEMVGRAIRYNEWGVQQAKAHPEFLPFVWPDPVFMTREAMINELEDKLKKGAKGVKTVPNSLRIYVNDPRYWPVYDFCNRTGLPLLSPSGAGGPFEGSGWDGWGRPTLFKYAFEEFKNLKVIMAHFGGPYYQDVVDMARKYPGFYTDISSQVGLWDDPGHMTTQEGVEWIRKAGVDKVLYGTNYPGSDPVVFAEKLKKLPLKDNELEKVASGNAKQLLGIK